MHSDDRDLFLIYTTLPEDKAGELATRLIDDRLAACANIIPGMRAVYRAEGKITEAGEAVLILKTVPNCVKALKAILVELHPYDTPAIITVPASANSAFATWAALETHEE